MLKFMTNSQITARTAENKSAPRRITAKEIEEIWYAKTTTDYYDLDDDERAT